MSQSPLQALIDAYDIWYVLVSHGTSIIYGCICRRVLNIYITIAVSGSFTANQSSCAVMCAYRLLSCLSTALWFYDYLLTIGTEVQVIWRKPMTGTALLYLVNRYNFAVFLVCLLIVNTPGNFTNKE